MAKVSFLSIYERVYMNHMNLNVDGWKEINKRWSELQLFVIMVLSPRLLSIQSNHHEQLHTQAPSEMEDSELRTAIKKKKKNVSSVTSSDNWTLENWVKCEGEEKFISLECQSSLSFVKLLVRLHQRGSLCFNTSHEHNRMGDVYGQWTNGNRTVIISSSWDRRRKLWSHLEISVTDERGWHE